MEDIHPNKMYKNISIKSKSFSYKVNFIKASKQHFNKTLKSNDIILADRNVIKKHKLMRLFNAKKVVEISANEQSKDFNSLSKVIKKLKNIEIKRNSRLIVIGGGITQDIGGFISSILFRGIKWVYYPTSFLSQCDSCIGGKTSINFFKNKNQLGNFYPPSEIFIDINFLKTLSNSEIASGVGEMSHYFFIKGGSYYKYFITNYNKCLNLDLKSCELMIGKSLMIKKQFIEKDEFDTNVRLILNYGHTFGHAIESLTNYKMPHGIAVAHGMNLSNYLSMKKNYISQETFFKMRNLLKSIYINNPIHNINIEKYINFLKKDKKNINKNIRCILTKGVGEMFIDEIKINKKLHNDLNNYFNASHEFT